MAIKGTLRKPRAWLQIGEKTVNVIAFEAHLVRSAGQTSDAEITMALDDPTNPGPDYWSHGCLINASLIVTPDDGKEQKIDLFSGVIDYATVDWGTRTVTAQMSDFSRYLFNKVTQGRNWTNRTTSQIVTELGGEVGLNVVAGPGSIAGKTFDGTEYTYLADLEHSWDIIQGLAHQDGYVAYVVGNTLYYVDPGQPLGTSLDITYVPGGFSQQTGSTGPVTYCEAYATFGGPGVTPNNVIGIEHLQTLHNFDLGCGVNSEFESWMQEQNSAYVGHAGSGGHGLAGREGGLTHEQTNQRAAAGQKYAAMHEYTIETLGPGHPDVQPNIVLTLSGTGTAFDIQYYIFEVVHTMNDHNGYLMEITGYNGSPDIFPLSVPGIDDTPQTDTPAPSDGGE